MKIILTPPSSGSTHFNFHQVQISIFTLIRTHVSLTQHNCSSSTGKMFFQGEYDIYFFKNLQLWLAGRWGRFCTLPSSTLSLVLLKYFNAVILVKKKQKKKTNESTLKEQWVAIQKKKNCIKLCQMHFKRFDSNDWELFPQNTH